MAFSEVERDREARRACLATWPEAQAGQYDPNCCRFPKSCSCPPPHYSDEEMALIRGRLRRERMLMDLAEEGASRCCYMPGAGNPKAWPGSRCDCKYVRVWFTDVSPSGEETGCCEIRAAYRIVEESLR